MPDLLKFRFIFLLSFVLNVGGAVAQVAFNNFTTKDGLPSNEVYSAFQDHDGFLWFGTDHGVVKYNGYNFKTYTTADGLTDNTVLEIKGDDDKNIWFLTLSGGLCYFDGKKFAAHPNNDTIKKLCDKRLPTSWEILRGKQAWLGFVELGIAKIGPSTTTLFTGQKKAYNDRDTVNIYVCQLSNGRYVSTSLLNKTMPPIPDPDIISSQAYPLDEKFSRVNFNLLCFPGKKILFSLERFLVYADSLKIIEQHEWPTNHVILKIQQTSNGKIWMLQRNNASYSLQLTDKGLGLIDSVTYLNNATSLLFDHQDNLWATTLDHGIYIMPNAGIKIFNLAKLSSSSKLLCVNNNSKSLFAGLSQGQLLTIDKEFNFKTQFITNNGTNPTAIGSITIKVDGEPQPNLDTSFWLFDKLDFYHTKILQVENAKYLVGATNGFALLKRPREILFLSLQIGFSKRVTEICKLSNGRYLIGSIRGLYYYEPENNNHFYEDLYFKNTRITAAKALSSQVFGVATRGKGIVLNIKNKNYEINEKRGLISDLAEDLYFENDTVLWGVSFKGISKIYFKLIGDSLYTNIRNYTKDDGLCSNQVNGITGFNNFIWLATNEGLCYFKPQDLAEKTIRIPLFFENISVNGAKQTAGNLELSYNQNNIFIEFNALYYKAIQGIRYKVRLKGIEPWKYTTLNSVQYFSLPPGKYEFEVAAEDADGKYQSDVHTLKFIIKPRFSDTALFKILISLLILLAVVLIVSSIFSYQKLKSTNVIKLLQAEFKALSYQINPHFIFNVLNSIQYYILKKDTDNAVHLLGSFSLLIRRIVNNSRQQYIGIIEEVECLKEYMDLEKMRLDNKFEYTIDIDSSIDVEEKNILPMIIQPLVENSIWHGIVPSLKPGIITVNFKKENGTVICTVTDNGVGINTAVNKEKSQNNLSLAMKNVSERLKIISELNDSTWAIKTEDRSLTDATQTGTVVTIIFPALKDKK